MPAAIPAVIAAVGAYATAGATITLFGVTMSAFAGALLVGVGTFALNTLGGLLAPKPSTGGGADTQQGQTQQVEQAVTERKFIYGETQTSGPVIFFGSSSQPTSGANSGASVNSTNPSTAAGSNKYLHFVIVLATHECDDIPVVYFNKDPIYATDLDDQGNVIGGKYANQAMIRKRLGTAGQTADPYLTATFPHLGANFTLSGCTYLYVRLTNNQTVFSSGRPNISAWVRGAKVYDPRTGLTKWNPNPALCLRDYATNIRYGLSMDATRLPDAYTNAAANVCEEIVNTLPVSQTVSAVATALPPSPLTFTINTVSQPIYGGGVQGGVCTLSAAFTGGQYSPFVYNSTGTPPSGFVNGQSYFVTIDNSNNHVVRLSTTLANAKNRIYVDARSDGTGTQTLTQPLTVVSFYAVTLNTTDLIFQTGDRVTMITTGTVPTGLTAGVNYYAIVQSIRDQCVMKFATTYANALAGIPIALSSAGSGVMTVIKNGEPRYTCNGIRGTATTPADHITAILTSMGGDFVPIGGQWIMKAAAYVAPTVTLTEKDMHGPVEIQTKHTRRERFNQVQGLYVSPSNAGQASDYPLVKDATFLAEDNNQPVIAQFDTPLTSRTQTSQRIGRIQLNRHRRQRTFQITTSLAGMQVQAIDTVMISHVNYGWVNKIFEVADFTVVPRKIGNAMAITCDLILQETDSAIYDFDESTQEIQPQPRQAAPIVDTDQVVPPGAPTATEVQYITSNGAAVKVRADITFSPSTDAYVRFYQIEYQLSTDTAWIVLPQTSDTSATINDIAPGGYRLRVKALTVFNRYSEYSTASFVIVGLSAPPSDVASFSVISFGDNASVQWDKATDLDVLVSGSVKIRHSADIVSPSWSNSRDIVTLGGATTQASVPMVVGTYLAKFVDSSGNESRNASEIIIDSTQAIQMNAVALLQCDPDYPSSSLPEDMTQMIAIDGVLRLDGIGDFDDGFPPPDGLFDDGLGTFDQLGFGQFFGGHYVGNYIDIGKVQKCYASSVLDFIAYNATDLFDLRSTAFDDTDGLFEGDDLSGVSTNFILFVGDETTDPTDLTTYTAGYEKFISGYVTGRYFAIEFTVQTTDTSYQIDVRQLRLSIDVPDVTDSGFITTTSGALHTFNFAKAFTAAPHVVGIINDAIAGDQMVIPAANVTSSNFQAGVLNTGVYVVRNITWFARGY